MTAVTSTAPIVERPRVELDSSEITDGAVRCPCERRGKRCNQLLGKLNADSAEFFCRACETVVAVVKPVFGVSSQNGNLAMNVQNPTHLELFALIATTEQQSATLRAAMMNFLIRQTENQAQMAS